MSYDLAADLRRRVDAVPELRGIDVEVAILSRAGFTGRRRSDAAFIDVSSLAL